MKTRYKIILIAGIIAVLIPAIIIFGAVPLMISLNMYSGFIMSSTLDSVFEEDFAKISEVKFFIEKYPDYTTNHSADFLGWKIIDYNANTGENIIHLSVKKSVLHQGIKVSAACNNGGYSVAFNIISNDVMDYLKNDQCFSKENSKSKLDVTDSLKIPNTERDVKLATGYKLYPGVGWVHPDDLGNQQPIYNDNPNNAGELILDIDAMIKEYYTLNSKGCPQLCSKKVSSNVFSFCGGDGLYSEGYLFTNNSTHYFDHNECEWTQNENYAFDKTGKKSCLNTILALL